MFLIIFIAQIIDCKGIVSNNGTGNIQNYEKRQVNNYGPGYTQTYGGFMGGMGGMGGINNYGPSYSQTYGKRSIEKRQINNMGPGYTQTYNGGFMGGLGGINNYGPSYSQTYGKRSIGINNSEIVSRQFNINNQGHDYTQNHYGAINGNIKNNGNNYQINAIPPLANNVFNNGKNYSYNFDLIKQGLNLSALLQKTNSSFQQFKNPFVFNNPGTVVNNGDNLVQHYNFGKKPEAPINNIGNNLIQTYNGK